MKTTNGDAFETGYRFRAADSGRCMLGHIELHCGNVFALNTADGWKTVRIEHSAGWYLIGVPNKDVWAHHNSEAGRLL